MNMTSPAPDPVAVAHAFLRPNPASRTPTLDFLPGARRLWLPTPAGRLAAAQASSGPLVLLVHGWEGRARHHDKTYDAAEADLRREWETSEHNDRLGWDKAQPATRDAWQRIDENLSREDDAETKRPTPKG